MERAAGILPSIILVATLVVPAAPASAQESVLDGDPNPPRLVADSTLSVLLVSERGARGPTAGFYFGLKSAAASYVGGDLGWDAPSPGPAFSAELGYQLTPFLGVGFSYLYASVPDVETEESGRRMGHVSVRAGLPTGRVSPYVQLGVHRVMGGSEEEFGPNAALGADWKLSQRVSVFPEIAFYGGPPEAVSGAGIGSFGLGMRINLLRSHRPPEPPAVRAPGTLRAGQTATFEAVTPSSQPVAYRWRIAGEYVRGNPVEYAFRRPGRYEVTLQSSNRAGARTVRLHVDVLPNEDSTAVDEPLPPPGKRPFRIASLYGPATVHVGEIANFRVRAEEGAARPTVYRWTMGDGATSTGNNVSHIYERPGRYSIVATARNPEGSDSDTLFVTVIERPRPSPDLAGDSGRRVASYEKADSIAALDAPTSPRKRPLPRYGTIDWSRGGFTLLAATSKNREAAEMAAVEYRRRGYVSGIYLDDSGPGSDVFRVIVGQYASEAEATAARRQIRRTGLKGTFMVQPLPQR